MSALRQDIRRWVTPVAGALLLALAAWILHRELRAYQYADLAREVRALPSARLLLAVLLTAVSYALLVGYDALALRYVQHPLPLRKIAFASFTGYAVSNTLGFPLLTGATLRYRLYTRWGVPTAEFPRIVGFYSTTFWLGALVVGGVAFLFDPIPLPPILHVPTAMLHPLGALMLLAAAGYMGLSFAHRRQFAVRGYTVAIPSPTLVVAQLVLSTLDWIVAAAVLHALLPAGTVSFSAFAGAFVTGQMLGIVSHVPGGVGVFESVLLLLLAPHLGAPAVIGTLLAYRAIYYLLPFTLAAAALGVHEGAYLRSRWKVAAPMAEWMGGLVPQVMAALVFLAGAILLYSGAVPGVGSRLRWLDRALPLAFIEFSHFLASAVGVALLLLARGLQQRVNAAFHLAVALLAAGVILSLGKGLDYEEALALTLVLSVLWASRREFSRPSALLADAFTPEWIVAVLTVLASSTWLGRFAFKHVEYSGDLWWRFARSEGAPRFLRATIGAIVVLGAVALQRLLRPARAAPGSASGVELARATGVIATQGDAGANLVLLGDKSLLFSASADAFLMYGVEGRSWIALGDPVGSADAQRDLVWRFRERCDAQGAWPVFYEVSSHCLPLYLDAGLTLSKLGEEARVPLEGFSLEGSARKGLRQTLRQVERDGGRFTIEPRDAVPALLPELRRVSDEWLSHKNVAEKGFSLGRFDDAYLSRFRTAVVRREGRVVAFANLMAAAPGTELSVDLMRYDDEAPANVMEYLFTQLMLAGSAEGYRWFNLGMAPLAGVESRRLAPLWSRVGGTIFRHGEHFYNFRGLYKYKEKFDPVWEPRYLASPGGLALPRVVADVSALIAGGLRGVVSR